MRALYPGSFDPLTNGHMDLIERAAALFGSVTVAVLSNPNKKPAFSVEQRIDQIQASTRHLSGIDVVSFDGLTVHCAATHQADLILRGLRAMSDFEYELQIAHTNRSLAADLETVFLATSTRHSFLSSSVVKEVARFGGPIDHMVPKEVAKDLNRLFNSAFTPR
ncbi:MAG: pantetheine-phosphate adenylyltransferase [Cyanobacteriota bacterium]|jgi:pantetheine-phosphate adenylyltransferase|nr:pantetheine-phosphate adenylyltransferase [Cyanobacteriota bacterium]|tara:strand:- start:202 stop:693 length:492 start_codon:yes stop_codon:yes gene_type:complete